MLVLQLGEDNGGDRILLHRGKTLDGLDRVFEVGHHRALEPQAACDGYPSAGTATVAVRRVFSR